MKFNKSTNYGDWKKKINIKEKHPQKWGKSQVKNKYKNRL